MSTEQNGPKRDESDVYDRQIRLWGQQAQAKISKARVLYIHLTGVSQEILKNMVLAGVRAVLLDPRPFPQAVLETPSFFSYQQDANTVGHAIKASVEELNPLLGSCTVLDVSLDDIASHDCKPYDVIVASRVGMKTANQLAQLAQQKLFLVDCFGFHGACVIDLGGAGDEYHVETGGKTTVHKVETYVPLQAIWHVPPVQLHQKRIDPKHAPMVWLQYRLIQEYHKQQGAWPSEEAGNDFVRVAQAWFRQHAPPSYQELFPEETLLDWARTAQAEVSPVCAVLGGLVGNEIIKAISGKGEPANNTLLLDGLECKCRSVLIQNK